MNKKILWPSLLATALLLSCCDSRQVVFSEDAWHFSYESGNVINSDSSLQFTFGNHILDLTATMISCRDSLVKHPGADLYIHRVLESCGLGGSRVCFYSPIEKTMWVELPDGYKDVKPKAISFNLMGERPSTSWVWDDDEFAGDRKSTEIYSNTFVNKRLGAIVVVDKLNYGDKPMACLHIFQTANKAAASLNLSPWYWASKGNLLDYSYSDILANWIDSRREVVFSNYRLGQLMDYRKRMNPIREELKEILRLDQGPRNEIVQAWRQCPKDTALHRRIARRIIHNDSANLVRVCQILDNYPMDFGKENDVLWCVIQHSNLELQQKYLPLFIQAAEEHKLKGEMVAVMEDRVACWSGRPQIYGSQGAVDDRGRFVPSLIADSANVDKRRAAMGMEPLQEYIRKMSLRP